MSLGIKVFSGYIDTIENINSEDEKKIGYFDEKLTVFISAEDDLLDGDLELDMRYDNDVGVKCLLKQKKEAGKDLWMWQGQISPKKACQKLIFRAKYRSKIEQAEDVALKTYQEVGLFDLNGVTLCEDVLEEEVIEAPNTRYEVEYSLNVYSLYRMSIKTVGLSNGIKSITCLEIVPSNSINLESLALTINEISIECDNNWVFKPITDIKFPVKFKPKVKLSLAYQIITTDHHTLKPITCIIKSSLSPDIKVDTTWITNIDLNITKSQLLASPLRSVSTPQLLQIGKKFAVSDGDEPPKFRGTKSASSIRTIKQRSTSSHSIGAEHSPSLPALPLKKYKNGSTLSFSSGSLTRESVGHKKGLKIKVNGPTTVKVGTIFRWNLELLNQSPEKMELIIYVQSSINKIYEKSFPPIPIQSSLKNDPIPLFNNQQLVRNFYQKFNKSGLISLSNHLRVSLDAGSFFHTELVLVAFEIGLFNLYDLRIVDVASGSIFECGKLLDVSVV